jgi:hypothetical protein
MQVRARKHLPLLACRFSGELVALATQNEGLRFIVRNPDLGVVPVQLDEKQALRYAGYTISVELDLGEGEASTAGTAASSPPPRTVSPATKPRRSLADTDSSNSEDGDGSGDYGGYGQGGNDDYMGTAMTVTSFGPPGSSSPIPVRSVKFEARADGGDDSKGVLPAGTQSITAIVYLVSTCGWKQPLSEAAFRNVFFGSPSSTGASVAGYFSTCSQGKVSLQSENVQIYEVNVSGLLHCTIPYRWVQAACFPECAPASGCNQSSQPRAKMRCNLGF